MVREPDLRSTCHGFESRLPRCRVQPWANCLHTCASVVKQYNLVPANEQRCSAAGGNCGPGKRQWQPMAGFIALVTFGLTAKDRGQPRPGTLRSFPVWNDPYMICVHSRPVFPNGWCGSLVFSGTL